MLRTGVGVFWSECAHSVVPVRHSARCSSAGAEHGSLRVAERQMSARVSAGARIDSLQAQFADSTVHAVDGCYLYNV